jgi:SSS family solute:Na+ symporter
MSMTILDWAVVIAAFGAMACGVAFSRKYSRSVSDFLAAGRTAGRYLISVALGMAMLGAITVVGEFEVFFKSGFCMKWWELTMAVAILVVTVSGWVIYRFRQTRALTLAQFFEQRYSRNFRVFAGLIAFLSGIINFGIFPAVSARFFIYFIGLPTSFSMLGFQVSTYAILMAALLVVALLFIFAGGQVSVIIAEFIQGVFSNFVFIVMILFFLIKLDWSHIFQAVQTAPVNASLINPFKTGQVEDFNFWYFLIGLVGFIYNTMSWQGTQAYNASASSAHEAKMAQVLGNWRNYPRNLFLMFIPVAAFTILNHPDFTAVQARVHQVLSTVSTAEIQSQLRVPLVLRYFLPPGLLGAFCAMMLAAFLSSHDSYLHSWGSIFIQDVVMPFRQKPFEPRQHLRVLRWSIVGVAAFIFFFSLLFRQCQHIYLFFAITGAIFVGGSGAVIIGGLYWKRGT